MPSVVDVHVPIFNANTVVDVGAVVVKLAHTPITNAAVFRPDGLHRPTCVAKPAQWVFPLLPLIKMGNLKYTITM